MNILGYSWEDIQSAQQGNPAALHKRIDGERTASVACFGCLKYFRLPQTMGTHPWPIQCPSCGYMHTEEEGKMAFWPITQ